MKEDLAGRKLPSSDFGESAPWWWIMVLAMNFNSAMKQLVLQGSPVHEQMKVNRVFLINLRGRIMEGAHEMMIGIAKGHKAVLLVPFFGQVPAQWPHRGTGRGQGELWLWIWAPRGS